MPPSAAPANKNGPGGAPRAVPHTNWCSICCCRVDDVVLIMLFLVEERAEENGIGGGGGGGGMKPEKRNPTRQCGEKPTIVLSKPTQE